MWCAGPGPALGAPGVRDRSTAANSASSLTGLITSLSVNNDNKMMSQPMHIVSGGDRAQIEDDTIV